MRTTIHAHPFRAGVFLFAAALAVAALVWWLIPDGSPHLSAQEVVEDACANAAPIEHYDASVRVVFDDTNARSSSPVEDPGYVHEYQVSGTAAQGFIYKNGVLEWEEVNIWTAPASESRTATTETQYTLYNREIDDGGQWGEWETNERSVENLPSGLGVFCGFGRDDFHDLQYIGEETVHGILTKKFVGTLELDDDPSQIGTWDVRVEFWIDSAGRRVQLKQSMLYHGTGVLVTYSGWNEPNIVSTPVVPARPRSRRVRQHLLQRPPQPQR